MIRIILGNHLLAESNRKNVAEANDESKNRFTEKSHVYNQKILRKTTQIATGADKRFMKSITRKISE
jgi:hypothetical protein